MSFKNLYFYDIIVKKVAKNAKKCCGETFL